MSEGGLHETKLMNNCVMDSVCIGRCPLFQGSRVLAFYVPVTIDSVPIHVKEVSYSFKGGALLCVMCTCEAMVCVRDTNDYCLFSGLKCS